MSDITPLLLDAKKEYTQRLQEIVEPQISSTFLDMFRGSDDDYYEFQMSLRQIPYWNSTIVNAKTQYLITQYPFFDNLVAAVIVTYVKVLSAIRLGDRPNVKLQLPKTEDFVHELYKQMARIVYYAPETIETNESMMDAVGDAIENSIRRLIPYDDILESYLAAPSQQSIPTPVSKASSSAESESDSEDDADDEDINISMPQQYTVPQQPAAVQQPAPQSMDPPAYDDAEMDDDEMNDDADDPQGDQEPGGQQGPGFVPPTSYPAPPPPPPQSAPPIPPAPAAPPAPSGQPGHASAHPPPAQPGQLFGSPQIRTGF